MLLKISIGKGKWFIRDYVEEISYSDQPDYTIVSDNDDCVKSLEDDTMLQVDLIFQVGDKVIGNVVDAGYYNSDPYN